MRRMIVLCLLGLVTVAVFSSPAASQAKSAPKAAPTPLCTRAGQWCVNRESSSGACRTRETTQRPQYGENLAGPYNTQNAARDEMCKRYEPASSDSSKCGTVVPDDACASRKSPKAPAI